MASQSFPAGLPRPLVSYNFSVESDSIRSGDATALFQARQRSESRVHKARVSWDFTDAELQSFESFFEITLKQGSLPFNFTMPFGDGLKSNEAVFFEGAYQSRYVANQQWRVTATLLVDDANEAESEQAVADSLLGASGGNSGFVVPLGIFTLESLNGIVVSSQSIKLSTFTLESEDYSVVSSSALDLSTFTLESGST